MHVLFEARPHLEFDLGETFADGLLGEALQLRVGVTQPVRTGRVGRISPRPQHSGSLSPARFRSAQDFQRLLRGEGVDGTEKTRDSAGTHRASTPRIQVEPRQRQTGTR